MTTTTARVAGWLAFAVLAGGLVGSWWVAGEHDRTTPQPGRRVAGRADSEVGSAAGSTTSAAESEAMEVFREIVAAHDDAMIAALEVAPRRGGFLGRPTRRRGAEEKRAMVVSRYVARALEHIAATRGMKVDELKAIYARGQQEGWPERLPALR